MWRDPGANEAQRGALHSMRQWNYIIGGRGFGKTAVLCIRNMLLSLAFPGLHSMITEQTAGDLVDVLIKCWMDIIPKEAYKLTHRDNKYDVQWPNGSLTMFRGRHAKDTISEPPFHGPTVGLLQHDEISLDRRTDVISTSGFMLRQKRMPNICDLSGTPRRNWLYSHCQAKGLVNVGPWLTQTPDGRTVKPYKHAVSDDGKSGIWYGQTAGNAYGENLYARMVDELTESQRNQYLLGEWVDVEGLIWDTFSEDEYPAGNMIDDGGFRRGQDYILSVDHRNRGDLWQACAHHHRG